jgi:hypothetical protein
VQAISSKEDPRSDPRSHVFLMAVLSTDATSSAVRVRNLSPQGALLEGSNLPAEKRNVCLKRGSLSTEGQIAWSGGRQCGIRFSEPIVVAEWVERAGPVGQQRIDETVAEFRKSPASNLRHAGPSGQADQHSLVEISAALLKSCERLAALPCMSVELAEELLKIEATARGIRDLGNGFR